MSSDLWESRGLDLLGLEVEGGNMTGTNNWLFVFFCDEHIAQPALNGMVRSSNNPIGRIIWRYPLPLSKKKKIQVDAVDEA